MNNDDFARGHRPGPEAVEAAKKAAADIVKQQAFKRDQIKRWRKVRPKVWAFVGVLVGVVTGVLDKTTNSGSVFLLHVAFWAAIGFILELVFVQWCEEETTE